MRISQGGNSAPAHTCCYPPCPTPTYGLHRALPRLQPRVADTQHQINMEAQVRLPTVGGRGSKDAGNF